MQLHLNGQVHPITGNWTLEQTIELTLDGATWSIYVRYSDFHVIIDTADTGDLTQYRVEVEAWVQGILDLWSFEVGVPLRAEFKSMMINGRHLASLRQGWPDIVGKPANFPPSIRAERLRSAGPLLGNPLIRLALADLRAALERHDDTLFYCYRAIESLRHWYLGDEKDTNANRRKSWEALREDLDIEREALDRLYEIAARRRHGGAPVVNEADRLDAMLTARRAMGRFVERHGYL